MPDESIRMQRLPMLRTVSLNIGVARFDEGMKPEIVGNRLVPTPIEVEFPSDGHQPALEMTIEVQRGVPVCTRIALHQVEGGREVRSKDVRLVRIEDWLEYIVATCAQQFTRTERGVVSTDWRAGAPTPEDLREVRAARQGQGRGAPKRIDREFLERVAAIYREHFNDRPVQAVQFAFGVSLRTASRYVELCRSDDYKLLPKTTGGQKKA